MVTLVILGAAMALAGCNEAGDGSAPAPSPGAAPESRTNPWLGDGGVAAFQLNEEFELDVVGDGSPELVVVSVGGESVRALEIELTITAAGGRLLYGTSWTSSEYPELRQAAARGEASEWVASQAVRERLADLMGDEALHSLLEADIDPASVRRELRLERWRAERTLPRTTLPAPEDEDALNAIDVPDAEVREQVLSLVGRPALSFLAGYSFRTIVWSPELDRFVAVRGCC